MNQYQPTAEEKILEAAKNHFVLKGYSGARMQVIANSAGVNKALLHYYYESKELLFKRVMEDTLETFADLCKVLIDKEKGSLHHRFRFLVHNFLQLMLRQPFLPGFVLHEAQQNPEIMYSMLDNYKTYLDKVQEEIDSQSALGLMKKVDARELLINIFSLALFPFLSMQVIAPVVFHNNQDDLGQMLDQRQVVIDDLVLNKNFVL